MASMAISPSFIFHSRRPLHKAEFARSFAEGNRVIGRFESMQCPIDAPPGFFRRLIYHSGEHCQHVTWSIFAARSGVEASIADTKVKDIILKDVDIVVESRDEESIHVRVDLTGEQTEKVFDDVLANLASTAPPIPGFRRKKGGKTSNVPKSFLLQVLGRDRVTKFVVQEILSSTMADYVEQENLKVRKTFCTTQTAEELESSFSPGKEFGFSATMELERLEAGNKPVPEIEASSSTGES